MAETTETQSLALGAWHEGKGARMVPFAGYAMPIQYEGIMAEHLWTRSHAGLFDVSHMGQLSFHGNGVADALEALLPGDIKGLAPGAMRYSMLLGEDGGIIDDLIVTNTGSGYAMVVNGACKQGDIADMERRLPGGVTIEHHEDRALLALQGPEAVDVLSAILPGVEQLGFMTSMAAEWQGATLWVSRAGYTGEDGYEISLPAALAEAFADALVADARVRPIGLGARDSLRLEAGLPLYGHDLDTATTPIMADLGFAISKRRREEGGFPGAERILAERENGPPVRRVGLFIEGRQPVREGALVLDGEGNEVGKVTSGGFSPSLQRPIAMAYAPPALCEEGATLQLEQRGKLFTGTVTAMPFVPHRYYRKPKGA